ncbi:MAG: sigma-70 family RNA polymerase sigma factor [Planctomycetes bacterium]|nr:sigma-70 family RNA polymerase sigma factor [Planctomycetota bacterium]
MSPTPATVLLLEHVEFVRRLATDLAGTADADEVVHDAWMRSLSQPVDAVREPRGWLRTVLQNVWRNRRRTERRRRQHEREAGRQVDVPSAADIVAREEVRRRVVAAVQALPQPLREVVLLHYYEGLGSPAIGARLGLSASAVRTRMQQAVERLRRRLDDDHGGERAAWAMPLLAWQRFARPPLEAAPAVAGALSLRWIAAALLALGLGVWWFGAGDGPSAATPVADAATGAQAGGVQAGGDWQSTAVTDRAAVVPPSRAPEPYVGALPIGGLAGRVHDAVEGHAAADTMVTLRAVEPASSALAPLDFGVRLERQARTDAAGWFAFNGLPAAVYELDAVAADGRRARVRTTVATTAARVDLPLRRLPYLGIVAVKVLDAQGRAVAGADVTLVLHCTRRGPIGWGGVPPITGASDAMGMFWLRDARQLEHVFEGFALARTADGRSGVACIARPEHRGSLPYVEVVVDRPGELLGTLTGLDAVDPRAGRVVLEPMGVYAHVLPGAPVVTAEIAADGTFRAVAPAGRHHARIELLGRRRALVDGAPVNWQSLPMVRLLAGERVATTIALAPAAVVRGRVLTIDGEPIAGADERARRAGDEEPGCFWHDRRAPGPDECYTTARATTGADGGYELGLAPGRWHVSVIAAAHTLDVRCGVEAGEQPVGLEHRLQRDGALRGRAPGELVALRAAADPALLHLVPVDGGAFAVRGLAPGAWQVGDLDAGSFVPRAEVAITAGAATFLDLYATSPIVVRGAVRHAGQPVPDVQVWGRDRAAAVTTAADGSFTLAAAPGTWRLCFGHRGTLLQTLELPPGGHERHVGIVELEAARVVVRVVDRDGAPMPATLWIWHRDDHGTPVRHPVAEGRLEQWAPLPARAVVLVGVRFVDGGEVYRQLAEGETEVVLRRTPRGTVALRVVDPEGAPRPGAGFVFEPWGRAGPAPTDGAGFHAARDQAVEASSALTDADGTVTVPGLPPGPVLVYFRGAWGEHGFDASLGRRLPPVEAVVDVRAGGTTTLELVLPRR